MTVVDEPRIAGVDGLLDRLQKNVLRIERDGKAAVVLDADLYEALQEEIEDLEDTLAGLRALETNDPSDYVSLEECANRWGIKL